MNATQRHVVIAAVETLQAERDELLELLGQVADAEKLGVAVIPGDVMTEIRRRVGQGRPSPPPRRNPFSA